MSTLVVRMLLIASLVAWSPAWCCCAIRAIAVGEGCHGGEVFSCCSRDMRQVRESPLRTCCSQRASCCGDAEEESRSPCRCADRVIEQQRLDTSAKVSAPRAEINVLWAGLDEHVASEGGEALAASHHSLWAWHPPPRSLFAQSCMLLL